MGAWRRELLQRLRERHRKCRLKIVCAILIISRFSRLVQIRHVGEVRYNWQILRFLQRTTRHRSKVRAARAARLFFLVQPIKFLIYGAVVAVGVFDAKTAPKSTKALETATSKTKQPPLVKKHKDRHCFTSTCRNDQI